MGKCRLRFLSIIKFCYMLRLLPMFCEKVMLLIYFFALLLLVGVFADAVFSQFLSDRKKRLLQKRDEHVRRRLELMQDFEMPTVSTTVKVSRDGQFIFAAGKNCTKCTAILHCFL